MSPTTIIHPLEHAGSSQAERLVAALLPENFRVDERNLRDLLVAAHRYASLLHYYDESNQKDGDWTCFWEVETLTFLAICAELDTEVVLEKYNALEIGFAADIPDGAGGPLDPGGEEITNYYDLIVFIHSVAKEVNKAYEKLPEELPLKAEIAGMIDKLDAFDGENLVDALRDLITIHKDAYGREHDGAALPIGDYAPFFGGLWGLPDGNAFEAIKFTSDYDRATLRNLFRRFFETLVKISRRAAYWFEREQKAPRVHQPHLALFLTFLRLFGHAQSSLNALTGKHLDYYYEKILCVARRAAKPDDVFLVLELAKGFEENRIEKGTAFLAGKDANGQPLLFEALEEYVVRNAKVAELKTLHFGLCPSIGQADIRNNPDVTLAYENGEEDPAGSVVSWRSMGDNGALPDGEIGFAISSPQLILREGLRTIDLEIQLAPQSRIPGEDPVPLALDPTAGDFRVELSATEEWVAPIEAMGTLLGGGSPPTDEIGIFDVEFSGDILHFRIQLERDAPPIEVPGEDLNHYGTKWPMLRVFLTATDERAAFYDALRYVAVTDMVVGVKALDIRENLIVQSDQGVFDGTQKVLPFGAVPGVGRRFYVGSTEIFQKALTELTIDFEWLDEPQGTTYEEYYCHYNALGYQRPDPKVEIDFIDRAFTQDINIEQLVRLEEVLHSDNVLDDFELTFRVTDVDFNPVETIQLETVVDGIPQTPTGNFENLGNGRFRMMFFGLPQTAENVTVLITALADDLALEPLQFDLRAENGRWTRRADLVLFPRQLNFEPSEMVSGRVGDWGGFALSKASVNEEDGVVDANGMYAVSAPGANDIIFGLDGDALGSIPLGGANVLDANFNPGDTFMAGIEKLPPTGLVDTIFRLQSSAVSGGSIVSENGPINRSFTAGETEIPQTGLVGTDIIGIQGPGVQTIWFPLEHATEISGIRLLPDTLTTATETAPPPDDDDTIILSFPEGRGLPVEGDITVTNGTLDGVENNRITITGATEPVTVQFSHPHYVDTNLTELKPKTQYRVNAIPKTFDVLGTANGIEVVVTDANGEFDASSRVEVVGENGSVTPLTLGTDQFEIEDTALPAGSLRIRVSKTGDRFFTAISPVDVNVSGQRIVINHALLQKARPFRNILEGTVSLANGTPVVNARVSIEGIGNTLTSDVGGFSFNLSAAEAASVTELEVRHPFVQSGENLSLSVDDDSVLGVRVLPVPIARGFSGTVEDIFGVPRGNIPFVIEWNSGEYPVGASASDGTFRFSVPNGIDDPIVWIKTAGFQDMKIDLAEYLDGEVSVGPQSLRLVLFPEAVLSLPLINGSSLTRRFPVPINALNLERDIRTQEFSRYDPTLKRGFVRFTLKETDFGHHAYPNLLTAYSIAASTESTSDAISNTCNGSDGIVLPNAPYTPATNGISIDYSSRQKIPLDGLEKNTIDGYYHLLPFGGYRQSTLSTENEKYLLKPFLSDDATLEFADGNLFIGLSDLRPETNLSLLFQIEEGTERKPDWQPPLLVWSYLAKGNRWVRFRSTDILEDGTQGLTKSGLVRLNVPKTVQRENTMLNPELQWLRVAAVENRTAEIPVSVHALPSLVSVRAQAILARFADRNNELGHLARPLPASTIGKLSISRTAIKKVEQPFASFGGGLPENGNEYYRRISERLRHRERAITIWDYEHLLLEAFPKLRRIKCLSHTRPGGAPETCSVQDLPETKDLYVHSPGYVTLIAIPDLRQRTATRQSQPRFSFGDLMEMEDYLREKTNLFVGVHPGNSAQLCPNAAIPEPPAYLRVLNPAYELVRLRFSVVFHPGYDATFYRFELDRELKHYLSPWLADPATDINFGRTLRQSALIAFVESREYVDVVADFQVFTSMRSVDLEEVPCPSPEDQNTGDKLACLVDQDRIYPASPRTLLTTFTFSEAVRGRTDHCITVVEKELIQCGEEGRDAPPTSDRPAVSDKRQNRRKND